MLGVVLAKSSVGFASLRGVIRKYRVEAKILINTIISRFLNPFLIRRGSLTPSPSPTPKIGPMSGEMSIAPIITAVELTFRPTDATIIENARIQTFGPLKKIFFLIEALAAVISISFRILVNSLIKVPKLNLSINYIIILIFR